MDCVSERLHCQGVLLESWQAVKVRNRAESHDEVVVRQSMDVSLGPVFYRNGAAVAVDRVDLSDEDRRMAHESPQRTDQMRDVDVAGRDFVKHWREEEEILTADKRDLCGAAQEAFEMKRRINATKAAAEHHDASSCHVEVASARWMFAPAKRFSSFASRIAARNLLAESVIEQVDHEASFSTLARIRD